MRSASLTALIVVTCALGLSAQDSDAPPDKPLSGIPADAAPRGEPAPSESQGDAPPLGDAPPDATPDTPPQADGPSANPGGEASSSLGILIIPLIFVGGMLLMVSIATLAVCTAQGLVFVISLGQDSLIGDDKKAIGPPYPWLIGPLAASIVWGFAMLHPIALVPIFFFTPIIFAVTVLNHFYIKNKPKHEGQ